MLACRLARNLHKFVHENGSAIRLVVAGIYEDVLVELSPSWVLHTQSGVVTLGNGCAEMASPPKVPSEHSDMDAFAHRLLAGESPVVTLHS